MNADLALGLFKLAAEQIPRKGKSYGAWVSQTTARFLVLVKAILDVPPHAH